MRGSLTIASISLVSAILLLAPAASADGSSRARQRAQRYFELGTSYLTARKYDQAISQFQEAYRFYPHAEILFNLAETFRFTGRQREALEYYQKFIDEFPPVGPTTDEAKTRIVQLRRELDDEAKQRAKLHYDKAVTYNRARQYDSAIEEFLLANQLFPNPAFLYNVAEAHRFAGRKKKALEYYREYLRAAPLGESYEEVHSRVDALAEELEPSDGRRPSESAFNDWRSSRARTGGGAAVVALGAGLVVAGGVLTGLGFGQTVPDGRTYRGDLAQYQDALHALSLERSAGLALGTVGLVAVLAGGVLLALPRSHRRSTISVAPTLGGVVAGGVF